MERGKIPTAITFRSTDKVEEILQATMTALKLDTKTDAIIAIIENSQPRKLQSEPKSELVASPQRGSFAQMALTSPDYLEREIQKFLRGEDSDMINLLLSDLPRSYPLETMTTLLMLHDK